MSAASSKERRYFVRIHKTRLLIKMLFTRDNVMGVKY